MANSGSIQVTSSMYPSRTPIVTFEWAWESQDGLKSTISYNVKIRGSSNYLFMPESGTNLEVYISADANTNIIFDRYDLGNIDHTSDDRLLKTGSFVVTRSSQTNIGEFQINIILSGTWAVRDFTSYIGAYSWTNSKVTSPEIFTTTKFGSGAVVTGVSDFTDETDPTITYTYDKGLDVESTLLEACISFTGAKDDIEYRPIETLGEGTYPFPLTATERSKFWTLLDNGTTASVRFYIRTTETVGEENVVTYNYLTKTFPFVNYKPVLTPLIEDINSDTLALTGDKYTMVRHFSTAYFDTQAVARKGGTVATHEVRNGDVTVTQTESTGQIENITSNTFYFTITDNRGYYTNDAVIFNNLADLKFIEYVKLTCSVKTTPITGSGDLDVTISGKYFEGSFGAASNRFTLDYDIHIQDEAENWINHGVIEPSVDSDNNYSYTFTIPELDYLKAYQLAIRVSDELMTVDVPQKVVVSQPLFDWDKDDFAFHIPVQMEKGFTYPQWVLWQLPESPTADDIATAQLGANTSITLDYPISSMPTGAVFVFSLYRDGAVTDASFHSFFVSRAEVQYLIGGKPHMFMMGINPNLSVFGSKYVYIYNDRIVGWVDNTNSGTAACGITFDNSKFVLRYVIGV